MTPLNDTELFWQAFRYVGEEMTPGEVTNFEAQLADDQAAREAVARVVELSQLVLIAEPEWLPAEDFVRPAFRSRAWMQPVGWIAVGAAACLAVVMAYQSFVPAPSTTQMASVAPSSAGNLALAWAIARAGEPGTGEPGTDEPGTDEPGTVDAVAANDDLPSTGPLEEFTEPVAPAWLLVAVEDARNGASREN